MNAAHLHLALVHIPIVCVPLALLLLLVGLWRGNDTLRSTSAWIALIASLVAVASFLLGEGAEEIVEEIAGITESNIEAHEEAGVVALWLTIGFGALSALRLTGARFAARLSVPLIILGLLSSGSLAYTAQAGGKIRHPEAYENPGTNGEATALDHGRRAHHDENEEEDEE